MLAFEVVEITALRLEQRVKSAWGVANAKVGCFAWELFREIVWDFFKEASFRDILKSSFFSNRRY